MKQTFWRSVAQCGFVLSTALFLLIPISAQQTLGSINGTVLDPAEAAVPDATITATNAAINFSRSTSSQSSGFFQMFNLPVGTYTVTVTHAGFETTQLNGITVQEAQAKTIAVSLKIGQVSGIG